jgi:uncharacterized protein YycO
MKILFCTSDKVVARGIRTVTWSDWSHVGIIDGAEVIEAVWPKVRVAALADVLAAHPRWVVVDVPCPDEAAAIAAARAQIGKPYDAIGMLGLGVNRDWQDDSRWWCSEHVAMVIKAGGLPVFRDGVMHRITPQHLWMLNYPVMVLPA